MIILSRSREVIRLLPQAVAEMPKKEEGANWAMKGT